MSETENKEQKLEETVKEARNSSENVNTSEEKLETKASELASTNESNDTVDTTTSTAESEEYIDPITEEYLIERNNLLAPQWWLAYELMPKTDKLVSLRLGC